MANLPVSFSERVQAKITESIADLIAPEEIKRLVDGQILHFQHTELPKMVREMVDARFRVLIKEHMDSREMQTHWDGAKQVVPAVIKKVMTENADEILASLVSNMAYMVLTTMRSRPY